MKIFSQTFLATILIFSSCKTLEKNSSTQFTAGGDKRGVYLDMNYTSPGSDSLVFTFDTISNSTFYKYKEKYHSKINADSTKIIWTDTSFIINTSDSAFRFRADTNDYSHFAYYNGYLKPLGLYIVTDVDGNNELGNLILMDKKTNKKYYLTSFFDEPCEPPSISPKNKYFISISNNSYEDNGCFMTLVKINKEKHDFSYQGLINCNIDDWKIQELVWINESSFAIKTIALIRIEDSPEPIEREIYFRVSFEK